MIVDDILARARFLHYENTDRSKYDITRQAINEIATGNDLRQLYTIFDIDYATFFESIVRAI